MVRFVDWLSYVFVRGLDVIQLGRRRENRLISERPVERVYLRYFRDEARRLAEGVHDIIILVEYPVVQQVHAREHANRRPAHDFRNLVLVPAKFYQEERRLKTEQVELDRDIPDGLSLVDLVLKHI